MILGIRDADFLYLEGKNINLSNLFLTDYHDSEMMMASDNQCISTVLSEYTEFNSREHDDIFRKILQTIKFLGYFRWYNELGHDAEELQFKFNSLGLGDLFDGKQFSIDEKALIEKTIEHSPNSKIRDVDTIFNSVKQLYDDNHDLLQLCNGHDLMKIMASLCSSR